MVPCVADWSIHIQVHVMHNSLRSFIPTIKSYKSLSLRPPLCDVISASVTSWKVQRNIFLFIRKLKPGIFLQLAVNRGLLNALFPEDLQNCRVDEEWEKASLELRM